MVAGPCSQTGGGDAAQHDDLAGLEAAERRRLRGPGQPGERLHGMAEQVAPRALAHHGAVDGDGAPEGREVDLPPVGRRRAEHRAGVEHLVRREGRGAEGVEVLVAVLHDLDPAHQQVDGGGGFVDRRGARGEVAGEVDGELALDAGVEVGREGEGAAGGEQVGARHEAGDGAGEAEVVLHAGGGGADLEAGGGGLVLQLGHGDLGGDALLQRPGAGPRRQHGERDADGARHAAGAKEGGGAAFGGEGGHSGRVSS